MSSQTQLTKPSTGGWLISPVHLGQWSEPLLHKNGPNVFLPLNTKIGGPIKYAEDKETICLTNDQARHIY